MTRFLSRDALTDYHRGRAWVVFLLYAGLIFFLSHQPGNPDAVLPFPHFDKFVHFVTYFVFATLLQRALYYANVRRGMAVIAFVVTILYGISDEYHQSFIPFRQADLRDLLADTIGAALGVVAFQGILPTEDRDPLLRKKSRAEVETNSEASRRD